MSAARQPMRHLAAVAQHPHQPLRDHRAERRLQEKALDAEIDQPRHGGGRGLGMQRRQHEMAGQRRMDGDMRGLGVADFADHDHVGVLANEGAHGGRKGETDRRLDLRLVDAGDFVFDRVFDGEDLAGRLVQDRKHGRKRRGLAAAGRPRHHDHAVRQRQKTGHDPFVAGGKPELAHFEQAAVARQQADHRALAGLRRHGRDAHVEFGTADADPRRAVLRQPPLGDVETGENFHPRDQRLRRNARGRRHRAQQAVDAHPHHEAGAKRLDVNVAGAKLDRALEQIVERAHHRRAAGKIAQALDIVVGLLARSSRAFVRVGAVRLGALVEQRRDVLERRHRDFDRRAENDFGGANGRGVRGIGDREPITSVRRTHREDRGLAQEASRKSVEARRGSEQLRQAQPDDAPVIRNLVGKFRGRQVGRLPQFPKRSCESGAGGIFDAGARLRRQRIFFEKMLPKGLCGKVSHRVHNANLVTGKQRDHALHEAIAS